MLGWEQSLAQQSPGYSQDRQTDRRQHEVLLEQALQISKHIQWGCSTSPRLTWQGSHFQLSEVQSRNLDGNRSPRQTRSQIKPPLVTVTQGL